MAVSAGLAGEIFYIELWHILSLILSVVINYYIFLKARKSAALYAYLLTQLMLLIWIVAKIFKTVSPTIEMRWLFIVTQYFGVSFLGACLLLFSVIYIKDKIPKLSSIILFFLPALLCFLTVLTNPIHHGIYSKFTFYSDSFGDLFYIFMAVSYLYLLISLIMLSKGYIKMFGAEKTRAVLFAMAIILPLIMNVFYVFKLFKLFWGVRPLFDYTPIATNISLMLFALGALKYRFFDIIPIANKQAFDALQDLVVVCGRNNKILACNMSAYKLLPGNYTKHGGSISFDSDTYELNERIYKVNISKVRKLTIYRLKDITEIIILLKKAQTMNFELNETKAELEHTLNIKRELNSIKARNFILQELHDVLGHSMVLAVSACEVEKINEAGSYRNTLRGIKMLLAESQNELKNTLLPENSSERRTSLIIAIESLISNASSGRLKMDITVIGSSFEIGGNASKAVFRMCQEAITNSIKHSGSDEIHIVLRYNEKTLEIFIIDNGQGCTEIKPGKGLLGMRERIEETGGTIDFSSDSDCGFRIHAVIGRAVT